MHSAQSRFFFPRFLFTIFIDSDDNCNNQTLASPETWKDKCPSRDTTAGVFFSSFPNSFPVVAFQVSSLVLLVSFYLSLVL